MDEMSVENGGMKLVVGENGRNPVKNLPRPRFVHHETHMEGPRRELGTPAVGGKCLTACATRPPHWSYGNKIQFQKKNCLEKGRGVTSKGWSCWEVSLYLPHYNCFNFFFFFFSDFGRPQPRQPSSSTTMALVRSICRKSVLFFCSLKYSNPSWRCIQLLR